MKICAEFSTEILCVVFRNEGSPPLPPPRMQGKWMFLLHILSPQLGGVSEILPRDGSVFVLNRSSYHWSEYVGM